MRALALLLTFPSVLAHAEGSKGGVPSRFYAGIGIATLELHDAHRGVTYGGSSRALAPFGGVRLLENLDLEMAYLRFDDLGVRDVAGSGTARLRIDAELDGVVIRAVGRLPLGDSLGWRHDWSLYGSAGYYESTVRRDVTELRTVALESARKRESGPVLGAGALYGLGPLDLRGYVQWFGVLDRREAREIGIAAQIRF